jgi:hypothetical protein
MFLMLTTPHYFTHEFFEASEVSKSHWQLFCSMPPDRGLSNMQQLGVKGKEIRLTYLLMVNADGSTKKPPLIIGKAYKPRAFKNKTGTQHGFYYRNNTKAWMTATIHQEWLLDWD